jgi:hypothetical protein
MRIHDIHRTIDKISIIETIVMYERLMKKGKIQKDGAAAKRLAKLRLYVTKGYYRFETVPESEK